MTLLQQEDYNREACTPLKQIIKQNVISVYRTPILLLPYILSNLYICRARILYFLTKGQMEASASRILVKESLIVRQTKRYTLPAFPEVENLGHGSMGRSWDDEKGSNCDHGE